MLIFMAKDDASQFATFNGFLIEALNSTAGTAVISAGAAIIAAVLATRAERKRQQTAAELETGKEVAQDLRLLLRDLAAIELEARQWMARGGPEGEDFEIAKDALADLNVKVGVLRHDAARLLLERGLYVLEDVGIAARWGGVASRPTNARWNAVKAMMEVAKAASRGGTIPPESSTTIERLGEETDAGLAELDAFWEEHGSGE